MSDRIMSFLCGIGGLSFVGLYLWFMVKYGGAETPKQVKARKQREAEEFAAMSPEVQQLHLHAQNKMWDFGASILMFFITCLFFGAVFCYLNWFM